MAFTSLFRAGVRVILAVVVATAAFSGCRRRAAEVTEYTDPHPLPVEPLVVDAPTIGNTVAASFSQRLGTHGRSTA